MCGGGGGGGSMTSHLIGTPTCIYYKIDYFFSLYTQITLARNGKSKGKRETL